MKNKGKGAFVLLAVLLAVAVCGTWIDSIVKSAPDGEQETLNQIDQNDYSFEEKRKSELGEGDLILVNNKIRYQIPKEMERDSVFDKKNASYKVKDKNVALRPHLLEPLNRMMADFKKKSGIGDVIVVSGFRDLEEQRQLYDKRVELEGKSQADLYVAQPGGSEHHTGYALDLSIYKDNGISMNYTGSGKYQWINENAYRYGFVVRYDQSKTALTGVAYEPWHFRYVGKPHAYVMKQYQFCLEEYIDYLKKYEYGKEHLKVKDQDANQYEIYYVKAKGNKTKVPVPKNRKWQISGNNVDGFIVTSKLN